MATRWNSSRLQHFSSTELVGAPNPPHRRHRRHPWLAGAATAILLFALIALWYAHRPLPLPHITEIVQLTSDVRFHRKVAFRWTDGARVYLSLEPPALRSVPVSGGDITEGTKLPGGRMRISRNGSRGLCDNHCRCGVDCPALYSVGDGSSPGSRHAPWRRSPWPALSHIVWRRSRARILRDWLPLAITLIPYWQTGQFFLRPSEKIQTRLAASDRQVFALLSQTGF